MASESDTMPPVDTPGTEEPSTEEPSTKEEPSSKPSDTQSGGTLVDPLEAPLPPEFTAKELVRKRKEEKGLPYACCFAICCCYFCHEKMEYILDYLCCQKRK